MRIANASRAAGMLIFTTLAWGAMFAVAKSALGSLDAFWLSTLRYVPAALAMLAILGASRVVARYRSQMQGSGCGFTDRSDSRALASWAFSASLGPGPSMRRSL